MDKNANNKDFLKIISELISKQKYGEAINYLKKIAEEDNKNKTAMAIKEQVQKILDYQNRDIFGSTNLDMDPWLE